MVLATDDTCSRSVPLAVSTTDKVSPGGPGEYLFRLSARESLTRRKGAP